MERVDGWTKRQWRQCGNGWLHFYPDEDECSDVSSQPVLSRTCDGAHRGKFLVTVPLTTPWSMSPFWSTFAVTKNNSTPSLKHSQAPAPPKQASECSEHAGVYERAPSFEEKPRGTDGCREGTLSLCSPSPAWAVFPSSLQLLELEKTGEEK